MTQKLACIFKIIAGAGFVISLAVHVASIFGASLFSTSPWFLHIGIFVVWLPAILYSKALASEFPQKRQWQAIFRGCPKAMLYIIYGLFAYAVLNFLLFAASGPGKTPPISVVIRGFSGHWLVFYYAAFAIFYSYIEVQKKDPVRRCQNGHVVTPAAIYCPECGYKFPDATRNI